MWPSSRSCYRTVSYGYVRNHDHPRATTDAPDATAPSQVDVAIVGSGFSGLVHGDQAARGGRRGLRRARARRQGRRHLVGQHLPRLRLRRPVAPLLLLLRAQPRLDAHLLASSPRSSAYLRASPSDFGVDALASGSTRPSTGADWDEDAQRWQLETTRGRVSAGVLVSAAGALSDPQTPEIAGPRHASRARSFHSAQWDHDHDVDRQARRRHRHRRLRDPVRAARSSPRSSSCTSSSAPRRGSCPTPTAPISAARAPPLPPLPAAAAARPRRHLLRPRAARARLRQAAAADEARRAARPQAHGQPGLRPRAAPQGRRRTTRSAASASCPRTSGIRRSAAKRRARDRRRSPRSASARS